MATDIPATVWRNTDGLGEYSSGSAQDVVNNSGIDLVDINGNQVVDTGVMFTQIPDTTWEEDDSQ